MRLSTSGVARASARHPWRILGFWVLMIALAGVLQGAVGSGFNGDDDFTSNPDSKVADQLRHDRMSSDPMNETVVIRSNSTTVDDVAYRQVVDQTVADLRALPNIVASANSYYDAAAAGDPEAEKMVSPDRHSTVVAVTLTDNVEDDNAQQAETYLAAAQGHRGNGFEIYSVGDLSGEHTYGKVSDEDLAKAEQAGLPVALLVLIVVFGALVAAILPIILGLVAIFVAVGLTAILSQFMAITDEVTIMISMIGLAVGIDYALFVIERYREERRHGVQKHDAIGVAGGTAGKAVFFSGGTVMLALLGMFFIPVTVFHSLAAGAILAVVVAVFATQTLIPALLSLLGDRVDWPRRRRYDAMAVAKQRQLDQETIHKGFWGRLTRSVMGHPVAFLVVSVVLLIGLALPAFGIQTGQTSLDALPESDVKTGYEILASQFYAGEISPVSFVVDGNVNDAAIQTGIANLTSALASDSFYGQPEIDQAPGGDLTVISVPMASDPGDKASYDAIHDLRNTIVPRAFGSNASHVYIGGDTASTVDFNSALTDYAPLIYAFVLGLSFLLLMLAFRSVVVPLKAIIMNLLSVGAAYGLLVLVFQHGVGDSFFGFHQTDVIVAWLPIFLFCVLFGLSMDYHVFLLSRIREHYDLTQRNEESVAVGLQSTGRIITGAALIMVAVFGSFASGRLVDIQQMGFGLGAAVLIDATIVRSILVPAAMKLLGDKNWYMPRWLGWLPDLRIEGEPRPQPHPIVISPRTSSAAD
ncbi:MAG: MMPL family transporter [Thermomicrobiales bacterium]